MGAPLPRSFFERPAEVVAPELLGKVVDAGRRSGRIVEVEAYGGNVDGLLGGGDPASHGYRGATRRTRAMFGPAGRWYLYFTYGMHWCANLVCQPAGVAEAVLLRALAPIEGLDAMGAARRSPAGVVPAGIDLCRGPARLAVALGFTGADDGIDACGAGRVTVADDGYRGGAVPAHGPRVGLAVAAEAPWRWWVAGDPHVSTYRRGGRRRV